MSAFRDKALLHQFRLCRADVAAMGASDRPPHPAMVWELADLQLAITAIERDKQDPSFVRSLDSQAPVKRRARMPREVAFDEPVVTQMHGDPIRTVEQAAQIVRSLLREQFTMRLSTLLVLERAVDGSEVAEACEAFRAWPCDELPSAPRAH